MCVPIANSWIMFQQIICLCLILHNYFNCFCLYVVRFNEHEKFFTWLWWFCDRAGACIARETRVFSRENVGFWKTEGDIVLKTETPEKKSTRLSFQRERSRVYGKGVTSEERKACVRRIDSTLVPWTVFILQ